MTFEEEEWRREQRYREMIGKALDSMVEVPHQPTLTPIWPKDGRYVVTADVLGKNGKRTYQDTDEYVDAVKVETCNLRMEEIVDPVIRRCKNRGMQLSTAEVYTKIFRFYYPELDFDAFSFEEGAGFDPMYTRYDFTLYKMG